MVIRSWWTRLWRWKKKWCGKKLIACVQKISFSRGILYYFFSTIFCVQNMGDEKSSVFFVIFANSFFLQRKLNRKSTFHTFSNFFCNTFLYQCVQHRYINIFRHRRAHNFSPSSNWFHSPDRNCHQKKGNGRLTMTRKWCCSEEKVKQPKISPRYTNLICTTKHWTAEREREPLAYFYFSEALHLSCCRWLNIFLKKNGTESLNEWKEKWSGPVNCHWDE